MTVDTRSKEGRDDPPIAQSMLAVEFSADPERVRETLLPPPLEPVGDGDRAWAVVGEAILPSIRQDEDVSIEATEFIEAAVGAPCRYEGEQYTVYPLLFLDRLSDGFKRGISRGIADVAKTRWHATCPGRSEIAAGDSVAGTATHRGDKLFDATLHLEGETDVDALPESFFDFVHYRYLPDPLTEGETVGIAKDLAVMECPSFDVGSVWKGDATLSFGDWGRGLLDGLATEVLGGYHVTMAYEYAGERVIADVGPGWGDHVE